MSQIYDPASFLDQETTQESIKRPPIPAVDYNASIKDVKASTWQSKDKVDEQGQLKSGLKIDVVLELDLPPEVKEACKIEKLTVNDDMLVDMNESKTAIDYSVGKNGRLRQYRDATGQNVAGQTFSPRMLVGRLVRVRIRHEEYPQGSGNILEKVGAIAKAV